MQVDYPGVAGAKIHAGFYWGYKTLEQQIYDNLDLVHDRLCPTCRTLLSVGHSLGAAVSGVAAISIATNYPYLNVSMYNIVCPYRQCIPIGTRC